MQQKSIKSRLLSILFWSIISAAFIGPGTVTTAARAGADHGFSLLWALLFSTFACLLLQEAAARLAILSGKNLGEAIASTWGKNSTGRIVVYLVAITILTGSIAYQAGNLLGALSGIKLLLPGQNWMWLAGLFFLALIALFIPGLSNLARLLGLIVAIMGVTFMVTAWHVQPDAAALLSGLVLPRIPDQGEGLLLTIGLIGTTVVPYNLFLGSGLGQQHQTLGEMRFGLTIAILLGGIISMAVLLTGTLTEGSFSFESLGEAMQSKIGILALYVLGFGLFAAGFTSSVTAPLATAITFQSLFGINKEKWRYRSFRFRIIWFVVLVTGLIFGLSGFQPIPVIIAAQALNGLLLPFIVVVLMLTLNRPEIMGKSLNGWFHNILLAIVLVVVLVLGLTSLYKAYNGMNPDITMNMKNMYFGFIIFSIFIAGLLLVKIYYLRKR